MHTLNPETYSHYNLTGSYSQNLSSAARQFIVALLGVKPAVERSAVPQSVREESATTANLAKLYRLASSYDSTSPNLANEIRAIAKYQ